MLTSFRNQFQYSVWQFKVISFIRYHPSIIIAPMTLIAIVLFFIRSYFLSMSHKI